MEQETIKTSKQINGYIKGDLNQQQLERLWQKFLQSPDWYKYFETELHLMSLVRDAKKSV